MIWANYDDIVSQLIDAGFQQPRGGWDKAIDSGKKGGVRCKVEGSRQGGAISLHTIRLDDGRDALIGAEGAAWPSCCGSSQMIAAIGTGQRPRTFRALCATSKTRGC